VTHTIHNVWRATAATGIGQTQIKKSARQPLNQISEFDPAHQPAAWPTYGRGTGPAENDGDLADLVWKYFAEEITEALRKVQEVLASEENSSTR
jgi:hypothetical protein